MKKYLVLALMLVAVIFALTACGNNGRTTDFSETSDTINGKPVAEYLQENYSLESEQVEIYFSGNQTPIIVTKDKDEIKALQESVHFDKWVKYKHDQVEGMENIYLKFNDETTIGIYSDFPYGKIGMGVPNDAGTLKNMETYFGMSEELLQAVNQIIDKYCN